MRAVFIYWIFVLSLTVVFASLLYALETYVPMAVDAADNIATAEDANEVSSVHSNVLSNEVSVMTDNTFYSPNRAIEVSIFNNLGQDVLYWERKGRSSLPFNIEKLVHSDWQKLYVPSACGCSSSCQQDAPGILTLGHGESLSYAWNQNQDCDMAFAGSGTYRIRFDYYEFSESDNFQEHVVAAYSNRFEIG